jgi:hypothetical protein
MEPENKHSSRKKFILTGVGTLAFFGSLKLLFGKKKNKTVKMLSQDGKLVEVDPELIKKLGKKVSNEEIHHWITTKKNLKPNHGK